MTNESGNEKGGGGQQPPSTARRNNVLPIDRGRKVVRRVWPISASSLSLNSGAGLLVVIGVLCGLLVSESDRKSPLASTKPDAAVKATTNLETPAVATPTPALAIAKPSPAVRLGASRPALSPTGKVAGSPLSNRAASFATASFEATHKKIFGGCTGQLVLTSAALRFRCPTQQLEFPIDEIARANKDGVVLKSGEKYHFAIANHTKDEAREIFVTWLSRVQPTSQQNSAF